MRRVPAPTPGLVLSVETYYGHGAIDNDYTRLYAEYVRGGRRVRRDVGGGEYLQDAEIRWVGPDRFVVCDNGLRPDVRTGVVLESDSAVTVHGEVGGPCTAAQPDAPPRGPTGRAAHVSAGAR